MRIGILFDLKNDYHLENVDADDFTSLEEVVILANTLSELGHEVKLIHNLDYIIRNASYMKESVDLVINLTEGAISRNREALLPAFLELWKIPYIGSDCFANAITLDKYVTKLLAKECAIPTPNCTLFLYNSKTLLEEIPQSEYLVLKPVYGGSSDGILLKERNSSDLIACITALSERFQQNILVEEFVRGSDYSISLYGNVHSGYKLIGAVKILDKNMKDMSIYDKCYKEKYDVLKVLPDWDEETQNCVYDYCLKLAGLLELRGFFRFDYKVSNDGIAFLEINPIPSLMTDGSFLKAIEVHGKNLKDIMKEILENESTQFESSNRH